MKKRIKLKKKRKINYLYLILIIIILIIYLASKQIRNASNLYVEAKTKEIITKSINKSIKNNLPFDNIFIIEKDNNKIIGITLNNEIINQKLTQINEEISNEIDSMNNTIIFKIPLFAPTNNIFVMQLGPKIKVRYQTNGNIINNIRTEVKNYGLNNALISAYMDIEIKSYAILPFIKKEIDIKQTILLGTRIIQGEIPNYFIGQNLK